MEGHFPVFVQHEGRNLDLEFQVYLAVSLGLVPETRRHDGGFEDIGRDHLAGRRILNGPQQNLVPSVFSFHIQGIGRAEYFPAHIVRQIVGLTGQLDFHLLLL